MFSSDFFIKNRKNLLQTSNLDLVIVAANGLLQRSADTTYPYRQDSNFWYLCGINQSDYILVISTKGDFLIAPDRAAHRDLWEGKVDSSELSDVSGIAKVMTKNDGIAELKRRAKHLTKIGVVPAPDAYTQAHGFYTNPARSALHSDLVGCIAPESMIDIRPFIARLRQVKAQEEIAAIQKAIDITAAAFKDLKRVVSTMHSEADIQHYITYKIMNSGAEGHAYEPIIATDSNATVIHYTANNAVLAGKKMILFDVGASYGLYAADISRTFALRKPTARLAQLHAAVCDAQKKIMKLIKPGLTMKQLELIAEDVVGKALIDLDVIKNKDPAIIRQYYPHAVSHYLGLDVHDAADYDLPLAEGMVITVEPGIYIPNEGIAVRIEDDVIVTKDGCRNLSADIPTDLLYYI